MTNEMKLLMAMCDALGFEVETALDYKERKEVQGAAMKINNDALLSKRRLKCVDGGRLDIDEDGMYTSYLIEPVISYKLTRVDT